MKFLPKRKFIRLPKFNYSSPGFYFITICSQNRQCLFGKIINGKMELNNTGKMVKQWWLRIPPRFRNVTLDQFQIMPNHFHGIIVINDKMYHGQSVVGVGFPDPNGLSLNDHGCGNRAPTLGEMVAYFKYQSTKQINQLRKTPGQRLWQRNYYEHVIRTI